MGESGVERCAEVIAELARTRRGTVVVITGAGISAESGLPTYRGAGGLWGQVEVIRVATAEALRRNPRAVWEWFQRMRRVLAGARPNPGHFALADIEDALANVAPMVIVTQNIDGLHQAAGSRRVLELHGSAMRYYCTVCGRECPWLPPRLSELPPRCACGGCLRPDVVLFGEPVPSQAWQEACAAVARAGVVMVVGTSLQVEPAASLPDMAMRRGAMVVEVNLEPTVLSAVAPFSFRGFASEILPRLAESLRRALGGRTGGNYKSTAKNVR
jgi:NAD-dependent deacetylase